MSQDFDVKAMQEQAAKLTAVGEEHKALERYLGQWDLEISMVMPGSPKQTWHATATYAWVVEGRWLSQAVVGEMMGAPYQSFSLVGYDTFAKNHVAASVSSMDNALIVTKGVHSDPENKVMVMFGTLDEYLTGELNKPLKTVTTIIDHNSHKMELWDLAIGPEGAVVLEFMYRRRR